MSETGGLLVITLGQDRFSIPVPDITEILRPRTLTRVPLAAPELLGLANLRGTALPVLCLAALLGRPGRKIPTGPSPSASVAAQRIVVVNPAAPVGLLVDAVVAIAGRQAGQDGGPRKLDVAELVKAAFGERPARPPVLGGVTAGLARAPQTGSTANITTLIGFGVGGREFALPLGQVADVAPLPASLAGVPHTDRAMLGAVEHRGGLLPVLSLRVLLGLAGAAACAARPRMLVTEIAGAAVGLAADEVRNILRVPAGLIDPVPAILMRGRGEARIAAIARLHDGGRLVGILSPEHLLDDETMARLATGGASAEPVAGEAMASVSPSGVRSNARWVIFRLAGENFAVPLEVVDEVVQRPAVLAPVPRAPRFLLGLMNVRGHAVPVIDQAMRFSAGGGAGNSTSAGPDVALNSRRVMVVRVGGVRAGLAVDAVVGVREMAPAELAAVPAFASDGARLFDRVAGNGHDEKMILAIDPGVLLDAAQRDVLVALAA